MSTDSNGEDFKTGRMHVHRTVIHGSPRRTRSDLSVCLNLKFRCQNSFEISFFKLCMIVPHSDLIIEAFRLIYNIDFLRTTRNRGRYTGITGPGALEGSNPPPPNHLLLFMKMSFCFLYYDVRVDKLRTKTARFTTDYPQDLLKLGPPRR